MKIKKMNKTQIGSVIPNSISGSIFFADSNRQLAQDNANLNWNDSTNTFYATNITGANVTSGEDPGHTHTGASLSGIDISSDTNLSVTSPITLTGDDIGLDQTAIDHSNLTNVTSDQHHAQSHTHASHTGIGADDHHAKLNVMTDSTQISSANPSLMFWVDDEGTIREVTLGASGTFLTSAGDTSSPTWTAQASIDHDALTNFVANEHIDWTNATQNLKTSGTGEFKTQLRISDTATGNPRLRFYQDTTLKAALQYIDTGDYFRIEDNGIVGFIQQSGKVGIGGIQPTTDLDVMVPATRTLGGTLGDSQRLTSLGGRVSNLIRSSLWLIRNATGTDWTTATLHDAITVDGSFTTPGTNTKTWWERDFQGGVQTWGHAATTYMTLDSTGLTLPADLIFTGAGKGLPYGHMYVDGTQSIIVALTINTPAEVKDDGTTSAEDGWLAGDLNLMTFPTGGTEHYITITKPGVYHITWNLSFKMVFGAANIQIHGGLAVDGTATRDKCEAHRTISNNVDVGNMAGSCMIDLPNGTEQLSIWLENTTNSNDVDVDHASLTAVMVGGT